MEQDTFVRHGLPIITVIGNDAGWTQIARDQTDILHDDVATVLKYSDYHKVAEALGAGDGDQGECRNRPGAGRCQEGGEKRQTGVNQRHDGPDGFSKGVNFLIVCSNL
ncbi:MAG: thiamine pyrophosphate-dependent enzyme [Desulfobacterales bacterium]